jgi:hypothetical protein
MIETGMVVQPNFDKVELLWCPSLENNPYNDASSVSFFNAAGLVSAMKTFGCEIVGMPTFLEPAGSCRRGFLVFKKISNIVYGYWEDKHTLHTRFAHDAKDWKPDSQ